MAFEHHFYMDTPASRHELRDALVNAGIGFEAYDFENISCALTPATLVSILDVPIDRGRPDNGVIATRAITFRDRKAYLDRPEFDGHFEREATLGIVALLRAFPNADAYWLSYDAERPTLLRRGGRLVLAQAMTENGRHWDAERQPYRAMVDLPYVVEPLGPWAYVPPPARPPIQRRVSSRGAIRVARQRIRVGLPHAGQVVSVELGDTALRVTDANGELLTTVPRR